MQIQTQDGIKDGRLNAFSGWSGPGDMGMYGNGSVPLIGLNARASYTDLYRGNPWVFAAIRALSIGLARSQIGVFQSTSSGDKQRIWADGSGTNSIGGQDLDRKLNHSSNRVGAQRRMRRTVVDFLVHGNGLWREMPGDGSFVHVPWRRVNPLLNGDQEILGWQILSNVPGQSEFLAPENVVHFAGGDDPDSDLGVSSLSALKYTLQLYEALQRHLNRFFENSARPSGNLKVDKTQDPTKLSWMQDQFRELYSNPENAGKVIITTGDFQPLTAAADQSQIIELVKLSREEIASVFRIPPPVLGILDNAIKANVQELRIQYIRDAVGGYAPILQDDIMAQVVDVSPVYDGLYVEWDFDAQMRPDFDAMATAFAVMDKTLTTDERRQMLGKPALPFPEAKTVATTPGSAYMGIAPPAPPEAAPAEPAAPGSTGKSESEPEPAPAKAP